MSMYTHTVDGKVYAFRDLKDLLAKASPARSGDFLAGVAAANVPILSSAYPRASTPPPFAALHNRAGAALGITLRPWPEALADYMQNAL